VTSSLLEVVAFPEAQKGSRLPQFLEFVANPEMAPFLVSSTRSVLWVERAGKQSQVRAAVRPLKDLEVEVVTAVIVRGLQSKWGNIQPLTTTGIQACRNYLNDYDITQVQALVSPGTNLEGVDLGDLPLQEAPWLPLDAVVVVPTDRKLLGTLGQINQTHGLALVHNPSRGIGVAFR